MFHKKICLLDCQDGGSVRLIFPQFINGNMFLVLLKSNLFLYKKIIENKFYE